MLKLKPARDNSLTDIALPSIDPSDDNLLSPSDDAPVFRLKAPSFDGLDSSSDDSGEIKDGVEILHNKSSSNQHSHSHSDLTFRQLDYLWLFDPHMHFNKR